MIQPCPRPYTVATPALFVLLAPCAQAQWTPPYYGIQRIGLADAAHTRTDGFQSSESRFHLDDTVVGISARYLGGSDGGRSAFAWTNDTGTLRIGLFDASHTRTDGYQSSSVVNVGAGVSCLGTSLRFNGSANGGQSAWIWRDGTTTRLGYTDGPYIRADGYAYSSADAIYADARAFGTSSRYIGSSDGGLTSWTWSPAVGLIRLGLFDGEHTRADGYQFSRTTIRPYAGGIAGESKRYGGMTDLGRSTWAWTPGTGSVRVGLVDETHTTTTGYRDSVVLGVSASGVACGMSTRYSPGGGQSGWMNTASGQTVRVGLADAHHTRSDGLQWTEDLLISASGQVAGVSWNFGTFGQAGSSAWVASASGLTTRIGYFDSDYRDPTSGLETSSVLNVTPDSRVLGYSRRVASPAGLVPWLWQAGSLTRIGLGAFEGYAGPDGGVFSDDTAVLAGQSMTASVPSISRAWVWTPAGGTQETGLFDAAHTKSDGTQTSATMRLVAGNAMGYSFRFLGSGDGGVSMWCWNTARGTVRVGLYDATHTATNGYQLTRSGDSCFCSNPYMPRTNSSGQATGFSYRYAGATQRGQSGWFFDPATGVTTPLVFSVGADGSARTRPTAIFDNGWVFGEYDLYSGTTVVATKRFLWSLDRGFVDPDSLVDEGISQYGWSTILTVLQGASDVMMAGTGQLASAPSLGAFVLAGSPCGTACAANLDCDSIVDFADYLEFLNLYEAGDFRVDFTGDSVIDFADYLEFLNLYDAGC